MMSSEGRAAERKADPMPASAVEVLHDDGRWYVSQLLGQHRDRETGGWRCGVRYSVAPGMAYQRVLWADQCRLPPEQVDQEQRRPGDEREPKPIPGGPVTRGGGTSRHDSCTPMGCSADQTDQTPMPPPLWSP